MSKYVDNEKVLVTAGGEVIIEGPVTGERLGLLELHPQMNNFRQPPAQLQALVTITGFPEGKVYIARLDHTIIGYVTFHHPDEYSRWGNHPRVIELGGVEVARDWRRCHVGSSLLEYIFEGELWEDYIVITTEYCRHWDTGGNNLTVWEYRDMMDKFFGRAGFFVKYTTDPDILEHPANALMARIGSRVVWDDLMLFDQIA